MKDRIRVLWVAGLFSLTAFAGVAVADEFPEGCVSCHVEKIGDVDFRLNTLLEQIGHRKVDRLKQVPRDCGRCHTSDPTEEENFTAMIHEIHFDVPKINLFVTRFDGACIHCHQVDTETGEAGLKNGPKNW
ncbi:MAG: hypothetical protein PVI25_00405 [Gammaproteobacteria bacterium]|jgi:mono/diheme cytochrome c family protein|nr:MAG: hypothetical protein AMJ59_24030 [Gammaproteobacteria bacterium SG8_31]